MWYRLNESLEMKKLIMLTSRNNLFLRKCVHSHRKKRIQNQHDNEMSWSGSFTTTSNPNPLWISADYTFIDRIWTIQGCWIKIFIIVYAGPIIFKGILGKNVYKHFHLLYLACRLLCSKTKAVANCAQAKELLRKFVILMPSLYRRECLIGNIHNLIHLADDVSNMGCLIYYFTAFP